MPLVIWAVASFASGLLAGFHRSPTIALAAGAGLLWACALARAPMACLCCFGAGLMLALSLPVPERVFRQPATGVRAGFAPRTRQRATRNIDSVFGDDAAMARALIVADQSELDPALKRRFADAGIVHMLAISGMHVGVVAASILLLLGVMRIPPATALVGTTALIFAYVWVIGFPPSALRAAAMVAAGAACRLFQRHTSPWALLAFGAAVPLANPGMVADLGYQLSVAGVAALIAAGALARRAPVNAEHRWLRAGIQGLLVSGIVTCVTAPLVAASFGRLSLIAPVTNVLADPVLALVQPILFVALVLSPWPALARFCAGAAHPLLVAFDVIARAGAAVPHGAVAVRPSPVVTLLLECAAVAVIVACVSRLPARAALVALCAVTAAVWIT